jgi:MFS family permease
MTATQSAAGPVRDSALPNPTGTGASATARGGPERSTRTPASLPRLVLALASCNFVSAAGGFARPFLVLFLTQERQLPTATVGSVAAAVGAGAIGSLLLGGWLGDRIGRRRTMLVGYLGSALGLVALGSAEHVLMIWMAAVGVGLTSELHRPAGTTTVADLPDSDQRVRAFGILYWAATLGFSVASVLGGVLARHGYGLLFWLNSAALVVAALIVWRHVPETRPAGPSEERRALLPVLVRDRLMIAVALLMVGHFALLYQAFSTLPLVMAADGLGPGTYGAMLAVNGIVIVVVQPIAVRLLADRDRSTVLGRSMLLVGLGLGLNAVVDGGVGYAVTTLLWTLGEIGVAVMFGVTFADLAPADLRGRYMGIAATSWGLGTMIAPVAGTALLDLAGPTGLWMTTAAVGIALYAGQRSVAPGLRRRIASRED